MDICMMIRTLFNAQDRITLKGIHNSCTWNCVTEDARQLKPHFLFPDPMVSSSKLLRASSRPPLDVAVRVNEDDLDSKPGWTLWVVDTRPPPEVSRFDLFSANSAEELGRLLDTMTLFEALLVLETRPLSVSTCCYGKNSKCKYSVHEHKGKFLIKITRSPIYRHTCTYKVTCIWICILHTKLKSLVPQPLMKVHYQSICA